VRPEQNCKTCKFSMVMDGFCFSYVICRRYPPSGNTFSKPYPEVNSFDWCGEYKEKFNSVKETPLQEGWYESTTIPT